MWWSTWRSIHVSRARPRRTATAKQAGGTGPAHRTMIPKKTQIGHALLFYTPSTIVWQRVAEGYRTSTLSGNTNYALPLCLAKLETSFGVEDRLGEKVGSRRAKPRVRHELDSRPNNRLLNCKLRLPFLFDAVTGKSSHVAAIFKVRLPISESFPQNSAG